MSGRHPKPQRGRQRPALVAALVLGVVMPPATRAAVPENPHGRGAVAPDAVHAFGPPLTALRAKLTDPNWLVAWLLKPRQLRPGQRMRRLRITPEEAQALAGYLYSGPPPQTSTNWRGGDPPTGEKLFVTRGCRGCHSIGARERSTLTRAPDLAGIGIKVRGDWLFNWLKSPRSYDPNTAMPQLALSDDDIRHLVAFLLSHREGADVVAAVPRANAGNATADVAGGAIIRFDCAKCHLMSGIELLESATGWMAPPRACASCHDPSMPRRVDTDAATTGPDEAVLLNGRRLVAYYGCRGCHRVEGSGGGIADHLERKTFAPPTLEGEGARVQTSWLVGFLRQPTSLRPWLQMRMPDFGLSEAEATVLGKYFAALSHVDAVDEPHAATADGTAALGLRRFAHFKCVQCHPASVGAELPVGIDPEDLSVNLLLAKTRLRPSWIRDFLARPKAVVGTATRMPAAFYTTDGVPKVDEPDRDIAAITAYLSQMTELPVAPSASEDAQEGDREKQEIDWTKYTY
jgi:cytochrome c2